MPEGWGIRAHPPCPPGQLLCLRHLRTHASAMLRCKVPESKQRSCECNSNTLLGQAQQQQKTCTSNRLRGSLLLHGAQLRSTHLTVLDAQLSFAENPCVIGENPWSITEGFIVVKSLVDYNPARQRSQKNSQCNLGVCCTRLLSRIISFRAPGKPDLKQRHWISKDRCQYAQLKHRHFEAPQLRNEVLRRWASKILMSKSGLKSRPIRLKYGLTPRDPNPPGEQLQRVKSTARGDQVALDAYCASSAGPQYHLLHPTQIFNR